MSTELLNRLDGSRKDQRLRDQMDRLDPVSKMDTMYPTALSRHNRECSPQNYKRTVKKKVDRRGRFRTQPITFMEIKVGRSISQWINTFIQISGGWWRDVWGPTESRSIRGQVKIWLEPEEEIFPAVKISLLQESRFRIKVGFLFSVFVCLFIIHIQEETEQPRWI